MASISRTQKRLALQREHLFQEEQKQMEEERERQFEQASNPFTRPTYSLTRHIPPTAVLNVRI